MKGEKTGARKPEFGCLPSLIRTVIWDKVLGPFIPSTFPSGETGSVSVRVTD